MEIFHQFGIEPVLLLAQVVNFLILLFLLKKFLYKPMLKMLETRKEKIAHSLKDVEEIEKRLVQTEAERDKKLAKTLEEAKEIVNDAKDSASQIIASAHDKASEDIQMMIKKSQDQLSQERDQMHQEIRAELADLVTSSLKAVTGKVLTKKDQEEIVKKNLKELK